ncbi:MAG: ArsR/SmtB family transcription factor [Solirubrobacterales bacterium]
MGTESNRKPTDLFTALAHPVRRRVLRTMLRENAETTPRELATRLDEPLSALSYHVRVLEECELVKLTRTKRVHGATQHFYRSKMKAGWARTALETTQDPPKKNPRPGEEKG